MRIILLLIILTVSFVYSQSGTWLAWEAVCEVTSPQMGSGFFTANVKYDWTVQKMSIAFQNAMSYTETYVFNAGRGYNALVSTGQFTYQYLYKTSDNCPCEVLQLQAAMPAWYTAATSGSTALETYNNIPYWSQTLSNAPDLPNFTPQPVTAHYVNTNFRVQVGPSQFKTYVISTTFWLDSNNRPAGFQLYEPLSVNQRTFTIKSITERTPGALSIVPPTLNCPCAKMVDIVLSLDRSGSISIAQWNLEYSFVKSFVSSFQIGPLAANIGIVNWNANQFDTISLVDGNNQAAVNTAVNNMQCCSPPPSGGSCCCCGTPIGGGLWAGGDMLLEGRARATRVLVLLTDGCQNHKWDPTLALGSRAIKCNCASEAACATNADCIGDITKWYNWIPSNVGQTKVVVVGVGDNSSICPSQLLLAAGGDSTNVYNPTSWNDLQNLVQTISSTACTSSAQPCINCCGICICGFCITTPQCRNVDQCSLGLKNNGTGCCDIVNRLCIPDACQYAICDPAIGCVKNNITCKAARDNCTEYVCNSTTIGCIQVPTNAAGCGTVIPPQCYNDTDCDFGDPCKDYKCVNTTGIYRCISPLKVCGVPDACRSYDCISGVGCRETVKTCNDNDACTEDSCDPILGCQYLPNSTPCPVPSNKCKLSICDKVLGCVEVPLNCSDYGYFANTANCTVPACNPNATSINNTCFDRNVCVTAPPTSSETFPQQTIILSAALGTAAIVGIVIGAAVLIAGVGTAAGVAIVGAAGAGGVAMVAANPVYVPAATSGTNVLFRANDG